MKTTRYVELTRLRPDRQPIRDEWIDQVTTRPIAQAVQTDGRIRRWASIEAMEGRYLRVVLLPDGVTVHNAFFDRRFTP